LAPPDHDAADSNDERLNQRARNHYMSKQKPAPKSRIRTGLKASGPVLQHGVSVKKAPKPRIRTGLKASGPVLQHGVRVRTR
jgi:phage tail protein X